MSEKKKEDDKAAKNVNDSKINDDEKKANGVRNGQRRNSRKKSNGKKGSRKKKNAFTSADQFSRLEMYEQEDLNNLLNQPLRPYEGFNGPKIFEETRNMTDQCCIPVFIILLIGTILHSIVLISLGDTHRLPNGFDFRGELCGVGGLIHLPYLYFAKPSEDTKVAFCVEQCPLTTGRPICLYDIDHFTITPFCYIQMSSDQIGRYCLPKEPQSRATVDNQMSSVQMQIKRFSSDLFLSWDLILISMVLISLSAYLFVFLLGQERIVIYEIWAAIWGSLLCFAVLAWLFWREYQRVIISRCLFQIDKHDCGGQRAVIFQFCCYGATLIGICYLFFVIKLFNRLNLGIGLIKAAAKVLDVLIQLRFFAMFVALFGVCFATLVYASVVYGLTIGKIDLQQSTNIDGKRIKEYTATELFQQTLGFQGFMVIYVLTFILAVNEMFNAYALAVWFFTKKKATVKIPLEVVLKELIFHHLGTCLYLTLIQIFLFVPKFIMSYVHYFLRLLPQTNFIVRFMQGCCFCCLACYQHCLRFISKHSMVQVSIYSEPYSLSAKKAYFLLHRNEEKVSDLDQLVEFILFQMKLCNSLLMSMPIYIYLSFSTTTLNGVTITDIESPLVPTLFVFICAFFFTSVYYGTFDISTKCVIQLYLVDQEMFQGEQHFTEDFIKKFMEFYGATEEKKLQKKSHKQLKYSAKVAPEDNQQFLNEEAQSDESESKNDDVSDGEGSEQESEYEEDLESKSEISNNNGISGELAPKTKKTAKLIDADPFVLDDQQNDSQVQEDFSQQKSQFQRSKLSGAPKAPKVAQVLNLGLNDDFGVVQKSQPKADEEEN